MAIFGNTRNKQKNGHTRKDEIRRPAGVSDWKVLFLFLFLACTCSFVLLLRVFLLRLNQGHPPFPLVLVLLLLLYYYFCYYYFLLLLLLLLHRLLRRLLRLLYSSPLLLPPFFPSTTPVVPVANDTAYSITSVVHRCSSPDAHDTDRPVLLLKMLLIYGSVFVSSSLRLPPSLHINLPCGNLSPLPPCLLPCSGLLPSQRLIWYTVNRCQ